MENILAARLNFKSNLSSFLFLSSFLLFVAFITYQAMLIPYYYRLFFLASFNALHLSSFLFLDAFSWLLFLITPMIIAKSLWQIPIARFGLHLPTNKFRALALTLIAFLLIVPITFSLSHFTQIKQYYGASHIPLYYFLFTQLVFFPLYYLAEEFFFRGFLFLTLFEKIGWHSYWVSDLFFTLAHAGKPPIEILLSIPVSVMLNFLTLKTKSIFSSWVIHLTIGALLFTLINWNAISY